MKCWWCNIFYKLLKYIILFRKYKEIIVALILDPIALI